MIDVRKVRSLGKLLLKLETRSRTGSNRKLLIIYFTYLLPGFLVPWLLTRQVTDPSGFEFMFVSFLLFSITVCFTIINELDNIIISKSEAELFSTLPIDDRLIVNGKMYMLLRYFTFLCIPLLLPGSIFFYAMTHSFLRGFLYLISGFMLILFIANVITLLYTAAVRFLKPARLGSVSMLFQVILIFILLISYQLVSYSISGRIGSGLSGYLSFLENHGLLNLFPQAWFALLPAKYTYDINFTLVLKILLPIFVCQMSYISLKWYLEANYGFIREKYIYSRVIFRNENSRKRFLILRIFSRLVERYYLRNNVERASYGLMSAQSSKDKVVRLSIIPMIIIPAALALFAAITNQLPIPFRGDVLISRPVFHVSILLCVLIVLNTALLGVKITNYPGASWIYDSYPMVPRKSFRNGIRKFFVIKLLVPVFVLIFIIFAFRIPLHYAALHVLFLFAVAGLYNTIYNAFNKTLPFTKENSFVNSLQRLTSIIIPLVFGIAASILMLVVYTNIATAAISVIIMLTITFWINYFTFHRKT